MEGTAQNGGMNKVLLVVTLLLICFGVAEVYTASGPFAVAKGHTAEFYMIKHCEKVLLALFFMFLFSFLDYRHWRWLGRVAFAGGVVLTIAALVSSNGVKGANRWILGIQPSEIMKLGMFVLLCEKLSLAGENIKSLKCTLIQPAVPVGITAILLLLQPNLSMMGIILIIVACVMLVAGVNYKYMGYAVAVAIPAIIIAFLSKEHSRARIMAFFAEEGEMTASNYQVEHSLQALGNGGLFGTGFGQGVLKWGYLPEAHKDVVYAVIGEELGVVGTFAVLILFTLLIAQGFKISQNASTRFGKYLALALTLSIFMNFAIHVCVSIDLGPTTGQPLPFISFGGTNLIYSAVAVGILLNISRPNSGRLIKEPYARSSSLDSSMFRNVEVTRSSV
ncbi:MAG: cell division protein FtsW [Fibrobacter sp.]|nr:cell division protein FtsW [Fibrobacter sp.]